MKQKNWQAENSGTTEQETHSERQENASRVPRGRFEECRAHVGSATICGAEHLESGPIKSQLMKPNDIVGLLMTVHNPKSTYCTSTPSLMLR